MKRVYLDYAATTPLDPRVEKAMRPFLRKRFGNPSSIHAEGVAAKKVLDEARTTVARSLEAHAEEIVFTSGGTEANNLAIHGVIDAIADRRRLDADKRRFPTSVHQRSHRRESAAAKPHIVTTNIEHASVMEPLRELERQGRAEVTYVPVESNGIVKSEKIIAAIRPNTVLISVMYANNEIGTIQPIAKIGKEIKNLRNGLKSQIPNPKSQTNSKSQIQKFKIPIFHVDGCQAPLYLHCLVNALGVDLMTLDGHKIYGPKGVGALYVRSETPLAPQLFGGGQERGLRSTTENVLVIAGFAWAFRLATLERKKESARVKKIRDRLYLLIRANKHIDEMATVNGSMEAGERLPNNLNLSFPGVDTEFLTLQLDAAGIACSTKSSCLKDEKESYVVQALSGDKKRAASTLRFTLGRWTTQKEIEYAAKTLGACVTANIESVSAVV